MTNTSVQASSNGTDHESNQDHTVTHSAHHTLAKARELLCHSEAGAMTATALLRDELSRWRRLLSESEWKRLIEQVVRPHQAYALLQEDPFTSQSVTKPRGYPGDAVLLDFIYHHPDNAGFLAQATRRGRAIAAFSTNTPAPRAVRNRAHLIAFEVERLLTAGSQPRFLSLACGHLRELDLIPAHRSTGLTDFIAIDSDEDTIRNVQGRLGGSVRARADSIKVLWTEERGALGDFDFIYAAGLYDYLPDRLARRLTQKLFERLRPNGKLWIANFLPDIMDAGYMEAVMDWWLIYRSEPQILSLCEELNGAPHQVRSFREPEDNIGFVEVIRTS